MPRGISEESQRGGGDNLAEYDEIKPKANIGDIVRIDGYESEEFEVYAVNYEYYRDAITEFFEIYYDCYSLYDGDYHFADQYDIDIIKSPQNVDFKRIRDKQADVERSMDEWAKEMIKEAFGDPPEIKKEGEAGGVREKSKAEIIDELLTELNDVITLIKMFGEHEDEEKKDRKYVLRKCEIEAKLREMAERETK